MLGTVHPVSTLLFLLGYGLVVPIAFRRANIPGKYFSAAFAGHQLGLFLAAVGWMVKGNVWIAVAHLAWAVVARTWFQSQ